MAAAAASDEYTRAVAYLTSLLNQTLHVHTTDGRIFVGQLKCTDHERNLILAVTHEYRRRRGAAAEREEHAAAAAVPPLLEMHKRFVGLVVVPGEYITKIEVED